MTSLNSPKQDHGHHLYLFQTPSSQLFEFSPKHHLHQSNHIDHQNTLRGKPERVSIFKKSVMASNLSSAIASPKNSTALSHMSPEMAKEIKHKAIRDNERIKKLEKLEK